MRRKAIGTIAIPVACSQRLPLRRDAPPVRCTTIRFRRHRLAVKRTGPSPYHPRPYCSRIASPTVTAASSLRMATSRCFFLGITIGPMLVSILGLLTARAARQCSPPAHRWTSRARTWPDNPLPLPRSSPRERQPHRGLVPVLHRCSFSAQSDGVPCCGRRGVTGDRITCQPVDHAMNGPHTHLPLATIIPLLLNPLSPVAIGPAQALFNARRSFPLRTTCITC